MSYLLQDLVSREADRRPDATAIVDRDQRTSYGQLAEWSDKVAHVLHSVGCRPGDRVCLLMGKSSRAIGAMLGVMKVGAMYVPLDPGSPAARLGKIVVSVENSVLLACSPGGGLVVE